MTHMTQRQRVAKAYALLKKVPDDIILAVMTDDLNLDDNQTCLVGSIVREKLSMMANLEFDPHRIDDEYRAVNEDKDWVMESEDAARLFGGTQTEWRNVFIGVTRTSRKGDESYPELSHTEFDVSDIELALVKRVDLAVSRA